MTVAKMGEAYGYRLSPVPNMTVAPAQPLSSDRRITDLGKSVTNLCSKLDYLLTTQQTRGADKTRGRKRPAI